MDKYNAFTFVKWIYFSVFNGFAFWLEPIQSVNWALVPMDIAGK
jgi:hypothetical protein